MFINIAICHGFIQAIANRPCNKCQVVVGGNNMVDMMILDNRIFGLEVMTEKVVKMGQK
jgi:hypothetical protein